MLQYMKREISRVFLIDDSQSVRETYALLVEDMDLKPIRVDDRIQDLSALARGINPETDAVICDYQLTTRNYSKFNGDVIVSSLFDHGIAAILCSRFDDVRSNVRNLRKKIPEIISPKEFELEGRIINGFKTCIAEHAGIMQAERKMWKTLVRVEAADQKSESLLQLHIIIPAWSETKGIEISVSPIDNPLYEKMQKIIREGEVFRAKALVNIGASQADELFLESWEEL